VTNDADQKYLVDSHPETNLFSYIATLQNSVILKLIEIYIIDYILYIDAYLTELNSL